MPRHSGGPDPQQTGNGAFLFFLLLAIVIGILIAVNH